MDKVRDLHIFGIGNPLLDIIVNVDDAFLQKYGLPKNSAIIADPSHESMIDELTNNYEIEYLAGGAAQTTLRYAQWVINKNNPVTTFLGAVGNDYFGRIMETRAHDDGLNVKYMIDTKKSTGTCAVLVTDQGKSRSLCAFLGASETFNKSFLLSHFNLAEKARLLYATGHMLSVSADSVQHMALHAHDWGKDFFFNLAAPYVSQRCSKDLLELLPYVDFFFANKDEALSFAELRGYKTTDTKEVAKLIANEKKMKYTNDFKQIPSSYKAIRVAIITQQDLPVILARTDSNQVLEFPVTQLESDAIRDTNGAGDAFAGGFLAMFIENKPLAECIRCAIYCAAQCIQQLGCSLPASMNFK